MLRQRDKEGLSVLGDSSMNVATEREGGLSVLENSGVNVATER